MKNTKIIFIVAILLIVFAGGGFYAGMKYQQSKSPRFGNFQGAGNRQFQQRAQGFRPVNGEIISADDKSITVKLQDGSSKIVILSDTTTISKSADATKADLKVGERVAVFGIENSDGSVTAQNIQLNPILRDNFRSGQSR
jgi:flagellar basal body-associated protein FliL